MSNKRLADTIRIARKGSLVVIAMEAILFSVCIAEHVTALACIPYMVSVVVAVATFAMSYSQQPEKSFLAFRMLFLLVVLLLTSFLVVGGWSALILMPENSKSIYSDHVVIYGILAAGSFSFSAFRYISSRGARKIWVRAKRLFDGCEVASGDLGRNSSVSTILLVGLGAIALLASTQMQRKEALLYLIFLISIVGVPYLICVCIATLDQLFLGSINPNGNLHL